ncbi:MAG: hypothetical protein H6621_11780 [Halobacteriovoraceae bacterium]|nr:hypothetical protein [Halobacteriovoraceae bacterium]MCB9095740.1 hypothetical protein [Halobacteriovoraceae bacterium]
MSTNDITENIPDNGNEPVNLPSEDAGNHSESKSDKSFSKEDSDKKKHNFKPGQMLRFVRVRFPGHARSLPFLVGKRRLTYGQKVVAMSDRGMAVGYINSFPYEIAFKEEMLPVRTISKIATDSDLEKQKEHYRREKEVETLCKDLITKHELDMNLTHVEFTQFGKKVVFYFTAPARVDFRGLVKDLVGELKMRIELRQISVRDRAAAVGGIGPCGRQLCCSSFLERYGSVNIKMAKNQDLTINFNYLNGVCGQIKCCIAYEDEVYTQKRKKLPEINSLIICQNGDRGMVDRLHILTQQFDLITEDGTRRRYICDQFQQKAPNDFQMPSLKTFDYIKDETSTVIGLDSYQSEQTRRFEKEISEIKQKEKGYSDKIFEELFGTESLLDELQ